jgi:hypothetical protein
MPLLSSVPSALSRLVLPVEEKQPRRVVAMVTVKSNHCPIVPRTSSGIVRRCPIQMTVASSFVNVFSEAVKDLMIVSLTKCLFVPILGHPSKNYRMNLDGLVAAVPSEGTGCLWITMF